MNKVHPSCKAVSVAKLFFLIVQGQWLLTQQQSYKLQMVLYSVQQFPQWEGKAKCQDIILLWYYVHALKKYLLKKSLNGY